MVACTLDAYWLTPAVLFGISIFQAVGMLGYSILRLGLGDSNLMR